MPFKARRRVLALALCTAFCAPLAVAQNVPHPAKPFVDWSIAEQGGVAVAVDRLCRARCDGSMRWGQAFSERDEHEAAACLAGCMASQLPQDHPNFVPLRKAAWERFGLARRLGSDLPPPIPPR